MKYSNVTLFPLYSLVTSKNHNNVALDVESERIESYKHINVPQNVVFSIENALNLSKITQKRAKMEKKNSPTLAIFSNFVRRLRQDHVG